MLNKLTIGKKLLLIVAVFSTVLAGMTTYLLMDMRAGMYEDRKAKLRALVEAAVNTVNRDGELAAAGKMPVEEAQKTALAVLTGINFEGKNYFNTTLTAEQTLLASRPPGQSMIVGNFGRYTVETAHDHEAGREGPARVRAAHVPGRVLHLVTDALPTTSAGYTIRTHQIALAQREAGLDPHVATPCGYPVTQGKIDGRRHG